MMKFIKHSYVVLGVLLIVYYITRNIGLDVLPIFNDESTYIRFGLYQVKELDPQPYSLLIGKEPLIPQLLGLYGSSAENLLLGARSVIVFWGSLTLIGIFLFSKHLVSLRAAIFASALYICNPFSLFFDRLALLDSAVSAISIWSLFLTYLVLQTKKWRYVACLGIVMGIGLWIKASSAFYLVLPCIAGAVYLYQHKFKTQLRNDLLKLFGTAVGLGLLIFLPLYTHPMYAEHLILLKQYTYPLHSIFLFPITVWIANAEGLLTWLPLYLTPVLFLLIVISGYRLREKPYVWLLLLWFLLPFLYELLYAKLLTARHLLPLTVSLFVLAGYGLDLIRSFHRVLTYGIVIVIIVWSGYIVMPLYTDPQQFPDRFVGRATTDMDQYVHGFSSGYGVVEAVDYLRKKADEQPIIIFIRNDYGNPEDAIVAYLNYHPHVLIVPIGNGAEEFPLIRNEIDPTTPIYYVSRGGANAGLESYFVESKIFEKPNDAEFIGVHLLKRE